MTRCVAVDDKLLQAWPLPAPEGDGDKESRGRVLVVAGSREMPGAAVLAATAALRAGAGKLVVATPQSVAALVAAALPEARVIPLPETRRGGPRDGAADLLVDCAASSGAVLVGPGMADVEATVGLVYELLPRCVGTPLILDALAMDAVREAPPFQQPVLLLPHAGEMAHLSGEAKDDVREEPLVTALRQAASTGAVVALKGATTCVVMPDGRSWKHESETPGLGTSGSGDVLAGLVAGLAARGATPEQAAVWAVALHARAGWRLEQRMGRLGYLARELAAEVPAVMHALSA
jgi:ADP-dependent NAD(P)H-hydrate dehydratase